MGIQQRIPIKKSSIAKLWFFFVANLNKLLNKQPSCWWLDTPDKRNKVKVSEKFC